MKGSRYDKEGGRRGILGHFSHDIPLEIVIEGSDGCSNALSTDTLRLLTLLT